MSIHKTSVVIEAAGNLELDVTFEYTPYIPLRTKGGVFCSAKKPDIYIIETVLDDVYEVSAMLNNWTVQDIRNQCFKYMDKISG
jgi:hypothetical protein